jgi:cell division protein FtsL
MSWMADSLFFLARTVLALIIACALAALGVYAVAAHARTWLRRLT